jgi:hypothetical protein
MLRAATPWRHPLLRHALAGVRVLHTMQAARCAPIMARNVSRRMARDRSLVDCSRGRLKRPGGAP